MLYLICLCLVVYSLYRIYDASVKLRMAQEEIRVLLDTLAKTNPSAIVNINKKGKK